MNGLTSNGIQCDHTPETFDKLNSMPLFDLYFLVFQVYISQQYQMYLAAKRREARESR